MAGAAGRVSRTLLSTQQVVDLLNDGENDDYELDECFFPGSDDELGFEEVELEGEEDTMYGSVYSIINIILVTTYLAKTLVKMITATPVLKTLISMRVNQMM